MRKPIGIRAKSRTRRSRSGRLVRYLLGFVLLHSFVRQSSATAQQPDRMLYEGTTYKVHGFQLSPDMDRQFSDHKLKAQRSGMFEATSNLDGFTAVLEVIERKLYVKKLRSDFSVSTEEAFGRRIPETGLLADWFTGKLVEYYGDPIEPDGLNSHLRSRSRAFHFSEGRLIRVEEPQVPRR